MDLPSKADERLKTKQCTRTCQCLIGIVDKDVMLVQFLLYCLMVSVLIGFQFNMLLLLQLFTSKHPFNLYVCLRTSSFLGYNVELILWKIALCEQFCFAQVYKCQDTKALLPRYQDILADLIAESHHEDISGSSPQLINMLKDVSYYIVTHLHMYACMHQNTGMT